MYLFISGLQTLTNSISNAILVSLSYHSYICTSGCLSFVIKLFISFSLVLSFYFNLHRLLGYNPLLVNFSLTSDRFLGDRCELVVRLRIVSYCSVFGLAD